MNAEQLNVLKNVGRVKEQRQSTMNAISLTILLHYYWTAERYIGERGIQCEYSESETQGIHYLVNNDLLESNSGEIGITSRGECHIEAILNAPYPVQGWTSPIRQKL